MLLLLVLAVSCLPWTHGEEENLSDEIVVQFGDVDLNSIKSNNLCSSSGNGTDCYLTILPQTIYDVVGIALDTEQCLAVDRFTPDTNPPGLAQFVMFDFITGTLVLSFNETIRTSSANFSALVLQSFYDSMSGEAVYLQRGEVLNEEEFSTSLTLKLAETDLNELQRRYPRICSNRGSCWAKFESTFLVDVAGNNVVPAVDGVISESQRAALVSEDDSGPAIVNFRVNLNVDPAQVNFTFSEVITRATFDPEQLEFINPNSSVSVVLTGGQPLITDEAVLELPFELDPIDVLTLKASDDLFMSINDTFIIYTAQVVLDRFENLAAVRNVSNALQASVFIADSIPPTVTNFLLLDMDNDLMQVRFSEPVDILAINYSQIILRSAPSDDVNAMVVELTGATSSRYVTDTDMYRRVIEIFFNDNDIRAIKTQPAIATGVQNSYIELEEGGIKDTAGNPSEATTEALRAEVHLEDTRGPELISFVLDLNSNTLALTFNDIVRIDTVTVGEITLQPDQTGISFATYTLMDSSVVGSNNFNFIIELSAIDRNAINAIADLATNRNNTYLSLTAETLDDIYGGNVLSVVRSNAQQATDFIEDEVAPYLVTFDLDFNSETLSLYFNETVDVDTFDVTQLTLLNSAQNATRNITLSAGIINSERYVNMINITLPRTDLNAIKFFTDFAVDEHTTYLSATRATIRDSNQNEIDEVTESEARPVGTFIPDSKAPVLFFFNFDLDTGQIEITFDETINALSFDPTGILIQSASFIENPISYYQLTGGTVSTINSTVVAVNITTLDLNVVKQNLQIATSPTDTFLTLSANVVRDMNDVSFRNVSAIQVSNFTEDSTPPELVTFHLNLDEGRLYLTFSETVDSTSLLVSSVTFLAGQNISSTDEEYTLTGGQYPLYSETFNHNSTGIVVSLGSLDLNELKRLRTLATHPNNTFLSITPSTIADMSRNGVVQINRSDALMASNFTEDSTSPILIAFSLNLNTKRLLLTFDETVNASSLNISSITLYSNASMPIVMYTLIDSTTVLNDGVVSEILLSDMDVNLIKYRSALAVSTETTFLQMQRNGVKDMNDNFFINASTILQVRDGDLTTDTNPPMLDTFDLDIDAGTLSLTFSEVINSSSLMLEAITIQSSQALSPEEFYMLTGGALSGTNIHPGHPPVVVVALTLDDLNNLKRNAGLAISNVTTYLSILSGSVLDFAPVPNQLVEISSTDALPVSSYSVDSTRPDFTAFEIDLTRQTLLLIFNETVNLRSLNVGEITLHNDQDLLPSTENYTLQTSTIISMTNNTGLNLGLGTTDINSIKLFSSLCTGYTDCYISLSNATIRDMNGNPLTTVLGEVVKNFTEDMITPTLDKYRLNMNSAELYLTFSEPVNVSSLNIDGLILSEYQGANETDQYHRLSKGLYPQYTDTQSENGVIIVLRLGTFDLYDIQRKRSLATTAANSFLTIERGAVLDMNDLPVENNTLSLDTANFIADTTPPIVTGFELDVDEGSLSLTFDETVDAATLDPGKLTLLQSNDTTSIPFLTLSSTSTIISYDDPTLYINLTILDYHLLRLLDELGTTTSNTFIDLKNDAVRDTFGNKIERTVFQATSVINDSTRPDLASFEVDLTTSLLILYFNEPVNVSTVDFSAITLQNNEDNTNVSASFTLTGGVVTNNNGLAVMINITTEDLNEIKLLTTLLVSLDSSFINLTENLIRDIAGNLFLPALTPLQAEKVTNDTLSPSLLQFGLDMNRGVITLEFNEPVNISTVNFSAITLQQLHTLEGVQSLNLSGGELVTMSNNEIVMFRISENDLNELKRLRIGENYMSSYISFTSAFVQDLSTNLVDSVVGRPVTNYTTDTIPPELLNFDLDLTEETLYLVFSETVSELTLDVTQISLEDETGLHNYTLTDVSLSNGSDATTVTILLGRDDLNAIKLSPFLATSLNSTYLSYTSATIRDTFNNRLVNKTSQKARNFTEDTTDPTLTSFELNLNNNTLTLYFSETVNSSTFQPSAITLQNSPSLSSLSSFVSLTGGSVGNNAPYIVLSLETVDLNRIKQLLNLATELSNTYISITEDLVRDMNGNPAVSISNSSAIQAADYKQDEVPPMLEMFNFNLNFSDYSELVLFFSETVSAPSLNIQGIILQDAENSSNYHQLQNGEVQMDNSSTITVTISKTDTDIIKERNTLATSEGNTYIQLEKYSVLDMAGNGIEGVPNGEAIRVYNFTPDYVSPVLLNFTLDLNSGQIVFLFSEIVNSQSTIATVVTLQSTNDTSLNHTVTYTLTGGYPSSTNSTEVTLILTDTDLNNIKSLLDLATSENNTYISFSEYLVEDMNGNTVVHVLSEAALQVLQDNKSPTLISFNLNLTSDILTLTFSETINASSFNQLAVTFYQSAESSVFYTLRDSYVTSVFESTEINVQLSVGDANEIKRLPLATSRDDSFISLEAMVIQDTNGNYLLPIPPGEAINVTKFTQDSLAPQLQTFTFNVSSGIMTVTFSETVNASTLDVTRFTLQSVSNASTLHGPEGSYMLTEQSTSSISNSHVLEITVGGDDLNSIKHDVSLAVSNESTFLSIDDFSVRDMNGNVLESIVIENAQQVTGFTGDFVAPELIAFNLYLTPGTNSLMLELVFSETVDASTVNASGFTFSNSRNETSTARTYQLTGGEVSPNDSTVVTIHILEEDLLGIRELDVYQLLTTPETSYIAVEPGIVLDMAGNDITTIDQQTLNQSMAPLLT